MNKFSQMAKKATIVSRVTENRNKISIDEIMLNYPDGITVTEFDFITSEGKTFPVVSFKEDETKFFFGGAVLKNICDEWVSMFEGDVEICSAELSRDGGVKMRFAKSRTKNGNNVTTVTVVD